MLLSENYLHYVKDIEPRGLADYDVISIEDLALMPRKSSVSDLSSNGIASHDSGHDSYLDDGKKYIFIFFITSTVVCTYLLHSFGSLLLAISKTFT